MPEGDATARAAAAMHRAVASPPAAPAGYLREERRHDLLLRPAAMGYSGMNCSGRASMSMLIGVSRERAVELQDLQTRL
jgi:hypothetical protein